MIHFLVFKQHFWFLLEWQITTQVNLLYSYYFIPSTYLIQIFLTKSSHWQSFFLSFNSSSLASIPLQTNVGFFTPILVDLLLLVFPVFHQVLLSQPLAGHHNFQSGTLIIKIPFIIFPIISTTTLNHNLSNVIL